VLDLFANALLQGTTYGIAVLGVAFAFRILRYPDLTADGSFMMGATVFAGGLAAHWSWRH
jgi:putative ABC transport system permease protein